MSILLLSLPLCHPMEKYFISDLKFIGFKTIVLTPLQKILKNLVYLCFENFVIIQKYIMYFKMENHNSVISRDNHD
jgi:hypothetical protein